jgi:glycosyltransferase involved in cell wall biosynthesis
MMPGAPHRVAYVIGGLGAGGAEYQLHELLRHLDREQFAAHVYALGEGGRWVGPIRGLGVPVTEFPRRRSADVARLMALRGALRRFGPDVLHTILWPGNCYGRIAAMGLGIPVRMAAERNAIERPVWQVGVERVLDRFTDAYLVNCTAVARVLVEHERLPREKVRVIPNGIDVARMAPFSLDRRPGRLAAGFDPDRGLIAQVGRLAPQKDHLTFLRAAALVAAEIPDVDFLVVGEGEQHAALEEEARRLRLQGRLRFLGLRHDVPRLLAAVDVLTLTSLYEGFPNVLLEAMATGAVAVATDVGGCGEVVVADESGLLVPPRAPDAVAQAVLRVLREPDLARRLALAARRRVEAEFSVEVAAQRTVTAYLALLRARRPGAMAAAA